MVLSRRIIMAATVSAVCIGAAAFAAGANAQPRQGERVLGYAVYARAHYVLTERADGTLRTCNISRQTVLNSEPRWECDTLPALP